MIYFLQSTDGGPIKIGFSDDVGRRRGELKAYYKRPLVVLATMEGGRDEERAMHDRFAHLRLGRTEQFSPGRDLLEFLGRPVLVGADPTTVEAMPRGPINLGRGRPRLDSPRDVFVRLRCTPEWKTWLEEAAAHAGQSLSDFLDAAATCRANEIGFRRKPPER